MKKSIFFGALICALLAMFASCSNPSGENGSGDAGDGGRTPVSGMIGKYASPYIVGDIVFNDGSATPYEEIIARTEDDSETGAKITKAEKDAAIAVIFYVGTGLNSDVNGVANTTTIRTLGVGLKHNRSGLAWCPYSALANDTNITTIQCPASGSAGALTFSKDKDGSDNLEQIAKFLNDADGVNDDTATKANYPAFYFAKEYSTEATNLGTYSTDWYLPTIAELFAIWKVKASVDAASALCGGSQFGDSWYWSSSQYASRDDNDNAYFLSFDCGGWGFGNKSSYDDHYVCAVRAFN